MRRYQVFMLMVLSIWGLSAAEEMEYKLDFIFPERINIGSYGRLEYADCAQIEFPGEPILPYRGVILLLPPNHKAADITISEISYFTQPLRMRILPGSQPLPISRKSYENTMLAEGEVYRKDEKYPLSPVSKAVTHYKNGHPVSSFTICPVIYYPARDSVILIRSITVKSGLKPAEIDPLMYKHNERVSAELERLVDNPGNLRLYSESSSRIERIDILVITRSDLSSAFSEYLEFKASCGFSSQILVTEDIYNSYNGADSQEQIRNAIIDHYQRYDVQYVILGGDSSPVDDNRNIIPHRGFFGEVGAHTDFDIPSDMYYSCLDGNWNEDADSLWGEFAESDYLEEVSIGRISAANAAEINHQLHKLLYYQSEPVVDDLQKCLLAGRQLHTIMYGGEYLEEIASGSDNWGYSTVGIADNIAITRLYEMYEDWEAEDLFDVFNSGTNLASNMSHGSTIGCFGTTTEQLLTSNITNDGITQGYFHCYSQACYSGAFDNRLTAAGAYVPESYAEKLCLLQTGAASFIANSRYGWFSAATTNGVSQRYAREFYDTIFDDNILIIGRINSFAKEKNLAFLSDSFTHRWTYCNLNLLGDPSMPLWTAMPENIQISFPDILTPGDIEIPFLSTETNLQYAVMMNGVSLGHGNTGFLPCSALPLQSAIPEAGMVDVYVNKPDFWQYHIQLEVMPVEWALVINEIEISDSEAWQPNGIPEYAEIIDLSLKLSNAGTNSGGDINLVLCCCDQYVNLIDSTYSLECPYPAEEIMLDNVFSFELDGKIPDLHDVMLFLQVFMNSQLLQQYHHMFRVSAPEFNMQKMIVTDDNNNVLDPGETVVMEISLINAGHSISPQVIIELFCTKQQITVFDFSQNVGMIPAGETRTAGFEVSCDPDFIPGDSIEFIVITQAGEYQLLQTQEYYLGVEVESFESSNFHQFDWYFPFTTSWEISDQAIDGRYSACTPAMGNMSAQRLSIDFESNQDGYISFWFKTFTDQSNNGFFAFFINSYPAIFNFTGNNDWTRLETFVPAGLNQFNWNFFTHEASDSRLWIDNIVFPPRDYVAFSDQSNITSPEIQLYPNPFNPTVNIDFFLPEAGYIEISIFNIKGQKIKSLLADQLQSGRHSTVWSASDCRGNKVSSGVYFIQFNIDDKIDSIKKCLLLK